MKSQLIVDLLKQGKKPLVCLTAPLWEDAWGQQGMIARITSFTEKPEEGENLVELEFDYNESKEHNLALQPTGWFLHGGGTGTAFESGHMKMDNIRETTYFQTDGDDSEVPVEFADSPLISQWLAEDPDTTCVEWLEKKVIMLKEGRPI